MDGWKQGVTCKSATTPNLKLEPPQLFNCQLLNSKGKEDHAPLPLQ